jgi:hypothetical protein
MEAGHVVRAAAKAVGMGLLALAAAAIMVQKQPGAGQRGQETAKDHNAYTPVEASPKIYQDGRSTLFLAWDEKLYRIYPARSMPAPVGLFALGRPWL